MTVATVIAQAERALKTGSATDDETDRRWQAILHVADLADAYPMEVWQFVHRWGTHGDEDVRAAVATCLLEPLLNQHFEDIFPRVQESLHDPRFASTFFLWWRLVRLGSAVARHRLANPSLDAAPHAALFAQLLQQRTTATFDS